jgi:hypothetical protein
MANIALSEAQAEIDRLKAELEVAKAVKPLTCKVSEKGGVSVYGLGRFPVTLYQEQWEKLIASINMVSDFVVLNRSKLKRKGE